MADYRFYLDRVLTKKSSDVLLPETINYRDRVLLESGEIINISSLNKLMVNEVNENNYNDIVLWLDSNAGFNLSGIGTFDIAYNISVNEIDSINQSNNNPTLGDNEIVFDRTNDNYLTYPNSIGNELSGKSAITNTFWVNPSTFSYTGRGGAILGIPSNTVIMNYLAIITSSGFLRVETRSSFSESFYIYDIPVPLNEWSFFAVVSDYLNKRTIIYLNDIETINVSSSFEYNFYNVIDPSYSRIGMTPNNDFSDRLFDGKLNDIRVYSKSLTELEINKIYNNTKNRYI